MQGISVRATAVALAKVPRLRDDALGRLGSVFLHRDFDGINRLG
jgi:hypothetical protein